MADYITTNIRNIALIGHGSEGKTTLTEAMLYAAGLVDRQGRVEDGTTMTDFDPEETRRKCSISAATAPVDWNGKIINVVDVPGYFDFVGEMIGPLRVVETAVIVIDAVGGLSVGAEKAWDYAGAQGLGRMFIINQMDRDHADFDKISSQLRAKYGNCVVPILLPLGKGPTFRGVVNASAEATRGLSDRPLDPFGVHTTVYWLLLLQGISRLRARPKGNENRRSLRSPFGNLRITRAWKARRARTSAPSRTSPCRRERCTNGSIRPTRRRRAWFSGLPDAPSAR
ncbi:elongation factor G 1 [Faecalibacterium sp. CAG:74]|nr:elongation factor G 1 [Faecalibacterium sp. CAG:74]